MADEQYRWLNRDAAERLLRGEPLEAVDADTRARADRLAEALGALAAEVSPVSVQSPELPGEEAALAAFRAARTARSAHPAHPAHSGENGQAAEPGRGSRTHTTAAPAADAGLVHLGRPVRPPAVPDGLRARWGRPVRFGLVAAVTAGMLGGVTVLAGGGALSAFRGDEPEPSATISAAQSPDRPLLSPSPHAEEGDGERGAWGDVTPEASPDASSKGDVPSGEGTGGTGGTDEDGLPGDTGQDEAPTQEWWNSVFSSCRDVRDGKDLDAGRRRGLEDAAGGKGKGQLKRYCEGVLAGGAGNPGNSGNAKRPGTGTGTGKGTGTGTSDSGDSTGPAGGGDKNTRSGNDSDEDDDSDRGKGRNGNGNGKSRNGNGKGKGNGNGNGLWNGNGKNTGGKNKSGKGGKGNGGNGHRGQLAAVAPIGVGVDTKPSGPMLTHPS
ncbi:hypothetical protein ACFU53_17930 [Streptomyces sp. NPDC057474]|uniref:hypothetical protein n=1 Tax=Streptomyces sp. NPDC057474 TaxID=3346144 RepID=UPI0036830E96